MRRLFFLWLALAILAALAVPVAHYIAAPEKAMITASVNFSYDGIESGLDPAGNRFDPAELKNAGNISAALGYNASDAEIKRIADAITVSGSVPSEMIAQITEYESIFVNEEIPMFSEVRSTAYYPTQYTVSLRYKDGGMNRAQGAAFLQAILDAYNEYFFGLYGYNAAFERNVQTINYSEYDYMEAVDILDASLLLLRNYLSDISAKDSTRYTSKATGYTFADLIGAIDTLRSEDIGWVRSYVERNNVTKNREELMAYYQFRIEAIDRTLVSERTRLTTLNSLIETYVKTRGIILGLGDSNWDGTPAAYEFTQPSSVYDSLISQQIACQTSISHSQEQRNLYQTRLERLSSGKQTGKTSVIEGRLKAVDSGVKQLLSDTRETAVEYFQTVRLQNAFQVLSVSSGLPLRQLLKRCAGDLVVAEALIFGLWLLASLILALLPSSVSFGKSANTQGKRKRSIHKPRITIKARKADGEGETLNG